MERKADELDLSAERRASPARRSATRSAVRGSLLGGAIDAPPKRWLDRLEGRETISELADDLFDHFHTERYGDATDWDRYPGW